MATTGERAFAPGFVLRVDGVLEVYDKQATTPEAALAALLRSTQAYQVPQGTVVRVVNVKSRVSHTLVAKLSHLLSN